MSFSIVVTGVESNGVYVMDLGPVTRTVGLEYCGGIVYFVRTHLSTAYTDCKHFLVDTSSGLYHFVGPKQQKFRKLTELLNYYRYKRILVGASAIDTNCSFLLYHITVRSGHSSN